MFRTKEFERYFDRLIEMNHATKYAALISNSKKLYKARMGHDLPRHTINLIIKNTIKCILNK